MLAIYSKHKGKVIITKQIEGYGVYTKTLNVIIFYKKNNKQTAKIFDSSKSITIKKEGNTITFRKGR